MADSVQYAIELAARLSGGDATASQLDAVADKLNGAGRDAGFFEDALTQVASKLDAARTASAAANAALGEGEATYAQLERAAVKAAKAAERAGL